MRAAKMNVTQPPLQVTKCAALPALLAQLLGFRLMQMGNTLQSVRGELERFAPTAIGAAGLRPFCIVAIIIALALVPIALTRSVAPVHEGGGVRLSLNQLYRQSAFAVVTACLCGVTTSVFFTLGPIFAQGRGLDSHGIAAFTASGTLGGFLMAWPLGRLSDRFDRHLVIIGAAVTASATLVILMGLVPNSVDTLTPNRFLQAINTIPVVPGVPYDTIAGDRGKGDSPHSSDGVVPYWSAHLEGAQVERIVPSGHMAHQDPQAVEEIRRILSGLAYSRGRSTPLSWG
jgi:hypothetical protein